MRELDACGVKELDAQIRDYLSRCENDVGVTDAFHAVLDVHRPNEYTGICEECGTGMTHNLIPYHLRKPCPTVRAIARELEVTP